MSAVTIDTEATGYPDLHVIADKIEAGHADCSHSICCFRMVANAIRGQVADPKPGEPTGLGAVVEDAHGCKWVLYTHPDSTAPWTDGSTSSEWDDVAAVKVLNEGMTP